MDTPEFNEALRVLTAARDSDWEPTNAIEAGQLREALLPELRRLHTHHADQVATIEEAIAVADQLAESDASEDRADVHEQLVHVLGHVVSGYRELGIRPEVTGNPPAGVDTRARVGIP